MPREKEPHAISESSTVSIYASLARMVGDTLDEVRSICGIVEIGCRAVNDRTVFSIYLVF